MALGHWAIGALPAVVLAISTPGHGQQDKLTWAEAVGYVAQHGSPFSFYGPVAKSLGLSDGTSVDSRKLSKPGNPSRDFFVASNRVLLTVTWKSGASPAYAASQQGVLLKAMDRNRPIPVAQAGGAFEAEKQWWIAAIAAEKASAGY